MKLSKLLNIIGCICIGCGMMALWMLLSIVDVWCSPLGSTVNHALNFFTVFGL